MPYQQVPSTGYSFGWPVNGSLFLIHYGAATYILKDDAMSGATPGAQFLPGPVFDNMPFYPLTVYPPAQTLVVRTTDTNQTYLVCNGTKYLFATVHPWAFEYYGIDESKMASTTSAFLYPYADGPWITEPPGIPGA